MRTLRKLRAISLSVGHRDYCSFWSTSDTPLRTTSVETVPSDCDPKKASLHVDAKIAFGGRIHVSSMPIQL
jgi:hypothetical protein